jgi:hypothetical protein
MAIAEGNMGTGNSQSGNCIPGILSTKSGEKRDIGSCSLWFHHRCRTGSQIYRTPAEDSLEHNQTDHENPQGEDEDAVSIQPFLMHSTNEKSA